MLLQSPILQENSFILNNLAILQLNASDVPERIRFDMRLTDQWEHTQ